MRAVIFECGQSFSYMGGCRVVVVVVAVCCGRSQYFVAMSLTAMWHLASLSAKKVGGGVCLHTCWWLLRLVTWPLDVIGERVVLGTRCCWWVVCCHPAVVVAWLSSVVVVVVVSHHCHRSWLLTWHSCIVRMVYRCVQVVVGGGRWCGDNGWASWVVVVVEEGGCCLLTCLLTPKSSISICRCSIWAVGHGTQNILKSFYCLLMVAWCRC